ncbi:MAG: hypothetical protein WDO06_00850 [Actinomycetota bacterium]
MSLSRRDVLKGAAAGAGFAATEALFGASLGISPSLAAGKSVEFGSYAFDPTSHLSEKLLIASGSKAASI